MKSFKNTGFTMVEVMVSLLVLSVGLIGTGGYQVALLKSSSDVQARSRAINIAQQKIEEIKSYRDLTAYDNIQGSATLIAQAASTGSVLDFSTTGVNTVYDLSWTTVKHTSPNYMDLEVVVNWNERNGAPQQLKLNSILSKSDPNNSARLAATSF